MSYISITEDERKAMLEEIGVNTVDALFSSIPPEFRLGRDLQLPGPLSEAEILNWFKAVAAANATTDTYACFMGAGAYHHFVPSVVDAMISRAEYYTAYTPYQPEISQGTLQAIFEYQTLICQLTGLEVANASLYDGASATAEAALMAGRVTGRRRILIAETLHPTYRQVLQTYTRNLDVQIDSVACGKDGGISVDHLQSIADQDCSAVIVQSPNFFGVIEPIESVSTTAGSAGALTIVVVSEGASLGLLRPPGELGADIVAGEGQSFGLPLNFGGPYLGIFACRDKYKRQMPGRLVGQTVDAEGRRGFVLTLSTREQHIRREKATSNICTNQGLCALAAAITLCSLGPSGLRQLAEQNLRKSHYLKSLLQDHLVFAGPSFNEFVVSCPSSPKEINRRLFRNGIIGGLPLGRLYPERANQMLVCVTEQISREQMNEFARIFKS